MDTKSAGLLIITIGVATAIVGILVMVGGLSWFGRLPGDIRIERDNTRIYIPITTMLLISVVLTIVSYVVRRFF